MSRVGIVAYGTALPRLKVATSTIAQAQQREDLGPTLGTSFKTVPEKDEDAVTLATQAAWQALLRSRINKEEIQALFVGSESHPYAVKPSGTMIASALGLGSQLSLADLQFACKAGTQALQIVAQYVKAGSIPFGLAIGADTAQAHPGDVLEFTAAAGAAAYLVGSKDMVAELLDTVSFASDTPDFWRRPGQSAPEHAGRFTAEPGYFHHVRSATQLLLQKMNLAITEFTHCVFHTPNGRFPQQIAKELGCTTAQLQWSLPVKDIGNTYAGASLLALASVLDHAKAGDTILLSSYGSGAGADSFAFRCTPQLEKSRAAWSGFLADHLALLQEIDVLTSLNHRSHP